MKNYVCLIFTIFSIVLVVRAQEINYSITYTATTIKKMDNKNKSSTMAEINSIAEETSIRFELLISDNKSLYKAKKEFVEKTFQEKIASIYYGATDQFYISLDDSEFIHQLDAYDDLFLIPIEKHYWKLSKDLKKIGDYTCYKATTSYSVVNSVGIFEKQVIAWYAPRIKASFGPRGYYGLPGLILQLQDDKLLFMATDIKSSQKKEINIVKPKEGKKLSLKEFDDLGKLYTPF